MRSLFAVLLFGILGWLTAFAELALFAHLWHPLARALNISHLFAFCYLLLAAMGVLAALLVVYYGLVTTVLNPFWWLFRRQQRKVSRLAILAETTDKKQREKARARLVDALVEMDSVWYE